MSEYAPTPALMYAHGKKFTCPCGCGEFKVELNTEPLRFWCTCGKYYTEEAVIRLLTDEMAQSGE